MAKCHSPHMEDSVQRKYTQYMPETYANGMKEYVNTT